MKTSIILPSICAVGVLLTLFYLREPAAPKDTYLPLGTIEIQLGDIKVQYDGFKKQLAANKVNKKNVINRSVEAKYKKKLQYMEAKLKHWQVVLACRLVREAAASRTFTFNVNVCVTFV